MALTHESSFNERSRFSDRVKSVRGEEIHSFLSYSGLHSKWSTRLAVISTSWTKASWLEFFLFSSQLFRTTSSDLVISLEYFLRLLLFEIEEFFCLSDGHERSVFWHFSFFRSLWFHYTIPNVTSTLHQMRVLISSFLLILSVSADFDDSLARNFFLPLSSAAYSDSPQQCMDKRMEGAKVGKVFDCFLGWNTMSEDSTISGVVPQVSIKIGGNFIPTCGRTPELLDFP